MKTRLIILIASLLAICTGCRKPVKCPELSWTDYNSVDDVKCNNHYNREMMKSHKGDTLKVYGWLFHNNFFNNPYEMNQRLTSNKSIIGEENGSVIEPQCLSLIVIPSTLMPENPYDSILYISGIVGYSDVIIGMDPFSIRVENITKKPE